MEAAQKWQDPQKLERTSRLFIKTSFRKQDFVNDYGLLRLLTMISASVSEDGALYDYA